MANNPITPTKSNYVNGVPIDAQYMDDLASALNRTVGYATQATANSTKTLVLADLELQEFTGTTAGQIVVMPVVSTLGLGMAWNISNKSTQAITVNSSGGNLIATVAAGTTVGVTCILITGTTAASWQTSIVGFTTTPSGGTVSLGITTFTTSAAVNLDNIFTSSYAHYKIIVKRIASTSLQGCFRFRTGGVTNTVASYFYSSYYIPIGSSPLAYEVGSAVTGVTSGLGESASATSVLEIDIFQPQEAQYTTFTWTNQHGGGYTQWGGGRFAVTTQFDGFSYYPTSGTATGTIEVIAYN